jgi:flagellar secretion chaperone FliS
MMQRYKEVDMLTRVYQASPHQLISILFEDLLINLTNAQTAIEHSNFPEKSVRITKALTILHGLESSLDFSVGGGVARQMQAAYRFAKREIIAGNIANDRERLVSATVSIAELSAAWRQIAA